MVLIRKLTRDRMPPATKYNYLLIRIDGVACITIHSMVMMQVNKVRATPYFYSCAVLIRRAKAYEMYAH